MSDCREGGGEAAVIARTIKTPGNRSFLKGFNAIGVTGFEPVFEINF